MAQYVATSAGLGNSKGGSALSTLQSQEAVFSSAAGDEGIGN